MLKRVIAASAILAGASFAGLAVADEPVEVIVDLSSITVCDGNPASCGLGVVPPRSDIDPGCVLTVSVTTVPAGQSGVVPAVATGDLICDVLEEKAGGSSPTPYTARGVYNPFLFPLVLVIEEVDTP